MRRKRTFEETFRLYLRMGSPNECWEWNGTRYHGYGYVNSGDAPARRAHRVAYELFVGPIPEGMFVLHSCDNPPCCNPHHLRAGTAKENTRDFLQRGVHWQIAKTHCAQGHPFDETNTYYPARGGRQCRRCNADVEKRRRNARVRVA